MENLLKTPGRLTAVLLLAGVAAFAQGRTAQPGAVNYTEGQVFVNGEALQASQNAQIEPGQIVETRDGRVELLLTPGVFLRLNNNSQARLDRNSITDTRVSLLKGQALVEAAMAEKDSGIQIIDAGFNTMIDKRGIYEFNADQPKIMVYDGELTARTGDNTVKIKKGHELDLVANAKLKSHGFDTKMTDQLYAWSKVRSEYMAEANMSTAQTIVADNPAWYYGTGWYWNPYWASWAFVPGAGYWDSPFGFGLGFYSPVYWNAYRPWIGAYRGGYLGPRGVVGARGRVGVPAYRGAAPAPAFRPAAPAAPAFRGGFGGGAHFGGGRVGGGRR